jgi:hypothetical protein
VTYATIEDLRAEGVSEFEADDARLTALITEATATIDRATGWFFEPRALTLRLDGRGTPTLEPPAPPLRVDSITIDGIELSLAPEDLVVVGAPVQPGFYAPRITRCHHAFPRGCGNVEIDGLWGYTEDDGSPEGRVPYEIRRVCMLLVLRWLPPLADSDADDARNSWRVTSMRTRDQSVSFDRPGLGGPYTGDPEIDRVLFRYRRPPGLGAA